ncbi:MAG: DUF305 domain-containing protein [Pseudomonadota bacterium]
MPNVNRRYPFMSLRIVTSAIVVLALAAVGGVAYKAVREMKSAQAATTATAIDIGFAQSMNMHHQQAIWMSQLLLDGRPTQLPLLAKSIINSQLVEMGEMRGWLNLWQQPLQPTSKSMSWMLLGDTPPDPELTRYLLACKNSATGMVGLATNEEMNLLRKLDGRARDELFLKLMLVHHEGSLPMAKFAAAQSKLPAVRNLAVRIAMDQSEEIGLIKRMINALAAKPH